MKRLLAFVLATLCALPVFAHKPSDAYLTLQRDGETLTGQWDIALRDLDNAIALDANGDGDITWGEVRARESDIAAYTLSRLSLSSGGKPCELGENRLLIDQHTDGAYAVLLLTGRCREPGPTLAIEYRLFQTLDPQHRGLINFVEHGQSRSIVIGTDAPRQTVGGDADGPLTQFLTYVHEGVWHIWLGFDHILFLLSLLLPAVVRRKDGKWQPVESFRAAFADVLKVVTAFTLAHSITLSLAVLGVVSLPSRFVESAIALSVVLAALNNLYPVVGEGRWAVAFAFGLLHGFGFAGALQDLGLPTGSLVLSLAGFNIGVEIGQLAIVIAFLPVAFRLRTSLGYRRVVLAGGSAAIAAIASIWLAERALDLPILNALALAATGMF